MTVERTDKTHPQMGIATSPPTPSNIRTVTIRSEEKTLEREASTPGKIGRENKLF